MYKNRIFSDATAEFSPKRQNKQKLRKFLHVAKLIKG